MDDAIASAARASSQRGDVPLQANEDKLGELLLLLAGELSGDPYGGATQLNKALFFAEFGHMRSTGRPITGVAYQRLPHGPAPRRLRPIRDRLVASGAAELVSEGVHSFERQRLRPLRPARQDLFSDAELASVHRALATVSGRTAAEVSALSHEHLGWQLVGEGEDIPYVTALLAPPPEVASPQVRDRAAELAHEHAERLHRPA